MSLIFSFGGHFTLPDMAEPDFVIASVKAADQLVWQRANFILEHSDSILLLGKDTGESLQLLKDIQAELESLGYYVYIIKEQPDKLGESIIQKVLRYALSSKFIIIENSEPSGHLYEIPHVTKMAECVTAFTSTRRQGSHMDVRGCLCQVTELQKNSLILQAN